MDYDKYLDEQFSKLVINLVRHDTSHTGLPAYIEAHIGKKPKDMGGYAKDLSNYISRRTGLRYEYMPEYRGRGKKTTVRWFMSWDHIQPIRINILKAFDKPESLLKHREYLPFEFSSLIIQNAARGVRVA